MCELEGNCSKRKSMWGLKWVYKVVREFLSSVASGYSKRSLCMKATLPFP